MDADTEMIIESRYEFSKSLGEQLWTHLEYSILKGGIKGLSKEIESRSEEAENGKEKQVLISELKDAVI